MGTCDTNSNRNLRPLIRRCDCSQFCFYDDVSVLESYNHRRSLSICCIDRNNDRGRQRNYKSKEYSKTLQVIYLIIGSVLGFSLFFLRIPLLSLYDLTQNAYQMADQILIILSIVMVGMSYQMPTGIGIIKGGGDVKYMMYLNLISTWAIVMPLSFLGVDLYGNCQYRWLCYC